MKIVMAKVALFLSGDVRVLSFKCTFVYMCSIIVSGTFINYEDYINNGNATLRIIFSYLFTIKFKIFSDFKCYLKTFSQD